MLEKKAEIIIEIDEVLLPNADSKFEAFCPECRRLVEMTSTAIAALELGISERRIFRLIEAREIHFVETDRISVCLNSASKFKT